MTSKASCNKIEKWTISEVFFYSITVLKHVKVFGHKNGFYTKTSSEDENIKREFCFKLKTNVQLDLFLLIKLKNTCSYKNAIVK